jgi:hypothetical protein
MMAEHGFGEGRATDVARADEEEATGFGLGKLDHEARG